MQDQSSHLNWKTAAIVGAIAVTTSVGIYYYVNSRKKLRQTNSLDIDDVDCNNLPDITIRDPRKEAIRLKEKGNSYFKGGNYQNAINCYTNALNLCPSEYKQDKAVLYQNRAVSLDNLKRQDEALLDLNEALILNPKYEKALIRRSKIYEEQGKYRDALIDITAASIFNRFKMGELMNRMEQIVKNIAKIEVEKELTGPPILQSDLYIKTYFESFPNDPLLHDNGIAEESGDNDDKMVSDCFELLKMGKYMESFKATEDILRINQNLNNEVMSRLHLLRGTFYLLSCREELALEDLAEVIKNSYAKPSVTVNALIKRAMIMIINDNIDEVDKAFTEALQIDPDCPDIYYHRGSFFESVEKVQEAVNDFSRALEQNSNYSFAAVHKVFNQSRLGALSNHNTFEEFKNLIKRFPNCVESNIIFAQVLLSEGKMDEAEKVCNDLLVTQSKSGTIMATLAMIKLSQNKLSEARKVLNETIKEDPKCSYSYNTLATVFIKDGDLQKALELLDLAVKYARNRQEMRNFIATREGVRAQLNVSVNYNIPPREIFDTILQGLDMPASYM